MYHLLETLLANTTTLSLVISACVRWGHGGLRHGHSRRAARLAGIPYQPPSRAQLMARSFPIGIVCRVPDS